MTEFQGRPSGGTGGSCMIAEGIPGGRRYHCQNDFELDEDFDDLVLTVVKLSTAKSKATLGRNGFSTL